MNCKRAAELMPDFLEGNLAKSDAEAIGQHVESCDDCRQLVLLAENIAVLPQEEPASGMRARFRAMVDAYEQGRAERSPLEATSAKGGAWLTGWVRSPFAVAGATAILLVAGFLGGRRVGNDAAVHSRQEISAMQTELNGMRQLMVLSMLQEESANERLQGVNWSTKQSDADPKILAALLRTLRFDSSVDVRLAALDALGRYGNHSQVRQGLAEALTTQQSPLVQVELIDLLVQIRDRGAVAELRKIQQDTTADPAVRQRAERAISELS
jgi:HEAT repeats/Putative zinc-finger